MKQTAVFSVEDSSIQIRDNILYLLDSEYTDIACTSAKEVETWGNMSLLPQSILYPTDEELAKSALFNIEKLSMLCVDESEENIFEIGFIFGRKSFGDKEFHLTRENIDEIAGYFFGLDFNHVSANNAKIDLELMIKRFSKTPTFPHTITVKRNEDGSYNWGSLKCKY